MEHKQSKCEHSAGTGVKATDKIFVEEDI